MRKLIALVPFLFLLIVPNLKGRREMRVAQTYYISYTDGDESNNGLTKNTPVKTLPSMGGGGCSAGNSLVANPDDIFILKGGDTWSAPTCMGWHPTFAGTSGHPVIITTDHSWFIGGFFTKPKFDGAYLTSDLIQCYDATQYITFKDIEFMRVTTNLPDQGGLFHGFSPCRGITFDEIYFHGWRQTGTMTGHEGGVDIDTLTGPEAVTISVINSEITNLENKDTGWSGGEAFSHVYDIRNTLIHDLASVGDNLCNFSNSTVYNIAYPSGNFDDTLLGPDGNPFHTNGLYIRSGFFDSNPCIIHSNLIYDLQAGAPALYPNAGDSPDSVIIMYNNILRGLTNTLGYVNPDNYSFCSPSMACPGGTYKFWNNTVDATDSGLNGSPHTAVHINNRGYNVSAWESINNHFIGPANWSQDDANGSFVTSITRTTNYPNDGTMQLASDATTQGFTIANLYAPQNCTNSLFRMGSNLETSFTTDRLGTTRTAWDIGPYFKAACDVIISGNVSKMNVGHTH